jgi:hypothetical protein
VEYLQRKACANTLIRHGLVGPRRYSVNDATLDGLSKTRVAALADQFRDVLWESGGAFGELESRALQLANELVRHFLQASLDKMAARYGDEVLVDGQRYRKHAGGSRRYHTLCGSVAVRRDSYRLVGKHNGPTVIPLELEAGIVENATPALGASVLQAFATMPLRHYEDEMRAAHRQIPSRSTLERIAKRTGEAIRQELPVIEPLVRSRERVPRHAHSISIGLDRTTIPMAEAYYSEREPKTRSHVRKRPPLMRVAFRMAYVATVAVNDKRGDTITSTRIAATANEGATEMMERLGAELEHLLRQRPRLPVVVIQDGAPELWSLVEEWLEQFKIRPAMKLIDRYHVDERLAQAAECVERDRGARGALLERWRRTLGRSDRGIRTICEQLDERLYEPLRDDPDGWPISRRPKIVGENARIAEGHHDYFRRHTSKICYATARKRGYPIGSGVTEGACKSVVAARFKRSGQRWFESGASPCLQLRTLHLNERLAPTLQLLIDGRSMQLEFN